MSQSVLHLRAPALECVRIALIGLGSRGQKTLERYRYIDGVRFTALVDHSLEHLEEAQLILERSGRERVALATQDSQLALASDEVDLVLICTDWYSHATLACAAMEQGRHVALEVPAALTLEDCWRLVHTAERTQRHCFLLENCCYDPFHLEMLARVEAGDFGELKHAEGAYIHNLQGQDPTELPRDHQLYHWMGERYPFAGGNAYPTHGLGPMAQLLGIYREDRFTSLYACASSHGLPLTQRHSTVLLQTEQGRTALLQLDLHSPRPYSRLQSLVGTEGYMSKYPLPILQQRAWSQALMGEALLEELRTRPRSLLASFVAEGDAKGVPNVMNYAMDARLIHCLREGLPLDISVYDAALWSAVIELSARSEQEQRPLSLPSFL